MVPLGRGAILSSGLSLVLLILFQKGIVHGHYQYIEAVTLCFFGLWFILILTGATMAAFIKCDNCGKRPTIQVKRINFPPEKPKNELEALINDFYPIEIRSKKFRCIHCGTEYSLQD